MVAGIEKGTVSVVRREKSGRLCPLTDQFAATYLSLTMFTAISYKNCCQNCSDHELQFLSSKYHNFLISSVAGVTRLRLSQQVSFESYFLQVSHILAAVFPQVADKPVLKLSCDGFMSFI